MKDSRRPEVIVLNDIVNRHHLSRYCAGYLLAHSLREAGFSVKVIDWFTKAPDHGRAMIKDAITSDLKCVMFCSTFLMIRAKVSQETVGASAPDYNERNIEMSSDTLWFQEHEEMIDWFEDIRSTMRRKAPDSKMYLGGGACVRIAHFIPALSKYIDLVVSGYGEQAIVKLMRNEAVETSSYNGFNFWKVPGNLQPLSAYPFTMNEADDFLPDEVGILEFSRGCLFNCKFCTYDHGRSAYLNEEELYEILSTNYDRFGITRYNIIDNCVNDTMNKVQILHRVSKRLPFDLEWISFARPDLFKKYPEMLEMMIESGAGGLFYGVETLHPKAGALCGKGGDRMALMELLTNLQQKFRNDVYTIGSFIIGLPGEPRESIEASMKFVEENRTFHFALFNSLVLPHPEFVQKTNHLTFQNNGYSAFSLNPGRYGIEFYEAYQGIGAWKHKDMTFDLANRMCFDHLEEENKRNFIPKSAHYDFVALRNAGFSREEIFNCANSGNEEDFRKLRNAGHNFSKEVIGKYLASQMKGI